MTRLDVSCKPLCWLLAAVLCAAGWWLYTQRVLIRYQIADAAAHQQPRGNLSDLYPRWLGARELLLRGRDPYSREVTREIQAGYYGRPLDPSRPEDPKDEERFAYPVYVAFVLAPTVGLSFESVEKWFIWFLLILTLADVALWLKILSWRPRSWIIVSLVGFTIGSPAVVQGLKLRQLSLLVAALLFAAVALLVSDRLTAAGALLALASIKPQLVWPLLLWLAVWTLSDWKRRYRLMLSFLVTMLVLVGASELFLPHWILRFWQAVHEYQRYTGAASVLDKTTLPSVTIAVAILGGLMVGRICWKEREQPANSESFVRTICLLLCITILIAPNSVLYNQVLLLPAMFLFARDWRKIRQRGVSGTLLLGLVGVAIAWPWISSIMLAALSFVLHPEAVQALWTVPLWTVWLIGVSSDSCWSWLTVQHSVVPDGASQRKMP
jgi:hypothetical protein